MRAKIRFKFNSGMGAIVCTSCSGIIKTGYEFTEDEKLAEKGLKYLPPQYCERCSKKLNKNNNYDILTTCPTVRRYD